MFLFKKDYTSRKTDSKYSLSERNEKQTKKHWMEKKNYKKLEWDKKTFKTSRKVFVKNFLMVFIMSSCDEAGVFD